MGVILTLNFNFDVCHCFDIDENDGFAIPNIAQTIMLDWTLNSFFPLSCNIKP